MRIKFNHSGKSEVVRDLEETSSVEQFLNSIRKVFGIEEGRRIIVKKRFGPEIDLGDGDLQLDSVGIKSGQQFDIELDDGGARGGGGGARDDVVEVSGWSCPVCTLINEADASVCGVCGTENPNKPLETKMKRVVVPADNTCLFASVAGMCAGSTAGGGRLRELVASTIENSPKKWEGMLDGKSAKEYSTWIRHPDHWGGGVELSVLSEHFGMELAAIEVRTQRVYVFGEGNGYVRRCYLMWDGIHYDMIARDSDGAFIFPSSDVAVQNGAVKLAKELFEARQFTDVEGMSIICLDDNSLHKGQKEALEHAKKTGFTNFAEYNPKSK